VDVEDRLADMNITSTWTWLSYVQSYLRYEDDKFVNKFDANCRVRVASGWTHFVPREPKLPRETEPQAVLRVLSTLPLKMLVLGIQTDVFSTPSE
jgi:homoserine acetyltransferase